jgi:hypothetical protein
MTTLSSDPPLSSTEVPSAEAIDPAQPKDVAADVSASNGRANFKKFLEDQAFVEVLIERSLCADGSLRSGAFIARVESVPTPGPTGVNRVVTIMRSAIGGLVRPSSAAALLRSR